MESPASERIVTDREHNDRAYASLQRITDQMLRALRRLRFGPPVVCVYSPLEYARHMYDLYLKRYARIGCRAVLLGMNPGPWGMVQTGIPFGEVGLVRDWLGLSAPIRRPRREHPRRPVLGLQCRRREVSGLRLWGWARRTFGTPQRFFRTFFVANYCPLAFFDADGRNLTPDRLPTDQRDALLLICDQALRQSVECLRPQFVVGVGRFAERRAREALQQARAAWRGGPPPVIGGIPHPSPASPQANRNWAGSVTKQLRALGIDLPVHLPT